MGGLTHTGGEINVRKWFEAVGTWMLFDVDIVLLSEIQQVINTTDAPECPFILDYNIEKMRKPGKGTGCAIHRHLLEICIRINVPGAPHNQASGYCACPPPHFWSEHGTDR